MNLLEKTVATLMENFGAGNHKPGSGSAAAFQAMVSAKLISTVISLTADEKRRKDYGHYLTDLLDFHDQIETRIYPKLAELFQKDSEQFDKTINARTARNNEDDEIKKNLLRLKALEELKISIDIPLQIAKLCKEVAEMATYIFDHGFRSARGDSQVGLSGAVAALAGCISIIRLNVLSFSSDEYDYTKSIVTQVNDLEEEYKTLSVIASARIKVLQDEFDSKVPLFEGINALIKKYRETKKPNIENCVKDLQNLIWDNRELIWKKNVPNYAIDILHPHIILREVLGYGFIESGRFAVSKENGEATEVAGVIDQTNKLVAISKNYPHEVKRFTAAHELAHAILHNQPILHRDLPADCSESRGVRNYLEIEADKFATCFLMPEKMVRREFQKIFLTSTFQLNEDTAFRFGARRTQELKREYKTLRQLSRKLASTEIYNDTINISLSKLFDVSTEAMAIRLEELNLVKY